MKCEVEMQIIRCINKTDLYDLNNGKYEHHKINAYYGMDKYCTTYAQMLKLAEAVQNEWPEIPDEDMVICEIPRSRSDRHANQTMLNIQVDAERVRRNIHLFTAL
jgi:hypothetical protein